MGGAAIPLMVGAMGFQMYQGYQGQQDQKRALKNMQNQKPPTATPAPTATTTLTPDTGSQLRRKLQSMRYGIASTLQSNPLLKQGLGGGGFMQGGVFNQPLKQKVGA